MNSVVLYVDRAGALLTPQPCSRTHAHANTGRLMRAIVCIAALAAQALMSTTWAKSTLRNRGLFAATSGVAGAAGATGGHTALLHDADVLLALLSEQQLGDEPGTQSKSLAAMQAEAVQRGQPTSASKHSNGARIDILIFAAAMFVSQHHW